MNCLEIILNVQSMNYTFGVDLYKAEHHVTEASYQAKWYHVDFAKNFIKEYLLGNVCSRPNMRPLRKVRPVTYLTIFLRVCSPILYSYILQSPCSLKISFEVSEGSSMIFVFFDAK